MRAEKPGRRAGVRAKLSGQTPIGLARLINNYDVARFFAVLQ
jgi:hypothetical protein